LLGTGRLGLRVKPQIGASKYNADLPDTSSFLILGFGDDPSRLFPGRSWEHKHLVIFVSTRIIQQTSAVAVARNTPGKNRGQ